MYRILPQLVGVTVTIYSTTSFLICNVWLMQNSSCGVNMQASLKMAATAEGFGASHTSFYTSAKAKDSYATLDEILDSKMADEGVRGITKETLAACVKITEALRVNLVTVADAQNSVFGDVQLGVDVLADDIMWDMAKTSKLVREASSEEEPVMVETSKDGRFTICWDPLDGSSIVDNNWAVGTIVGTICIINEKDNFQIFLYLSIGVSGARWRGAPC